MNFEGPTLKCAICQRALPVADAEPGYTRHWHYSYICRDCKRNRPISKKETSLLDLIEDKTIHQLEESLPPFNFSNFRVPFLISLLIITIVGSIIITSGENGISGFLVSNEDTKKEWEWERYSAMYIGPEKLYFENYIQFGEYKPTDCKKSIKIYDESDVEIPVEISSENYVNNKCVSLKMSALNKGVNTSKVTKYIIFYKSSTGPKQW